MEFKNRGSSIVPRNTTNITCQCKLNEKIYTKNNKKYIDIELSNETIKTIKEIHEKSKTYLKNQNVHDPLSGKILRVKVPWNNNRIMCKTDEYFYEIEKDEPIKVNIEYCGVWNVGDYSGVAWKLVLINKI